MQHKMQTFGACVRAAVERDAESWGMMRIICLRGREKVFCFECDSPTELQSSQQWIATSLHESSSDRCQADRTVTVQCEDE